MQMGSQFVMVEFEEHAASCECGGHVQFESQEQHEMVMMCRARARAEREEASRRREQFRCSGMWSR